VVTNAHVIGEEFLSAVEVRFPSAPAGQQGPLAVELLYEDLRRDLAFLRVATSLPAIEVAPSYAFVKGEDITVIGNPGLGDQVVLENAVSRGVMSAKTVIDGRHYFQINMAINPGNSGGPVFDSSGRAIGVVSLKSNRAEGMAFCIPLDELRAAIARVGPPDPGLASRHRAQAAFRLLTAAGALYGPALDIRAGILGMTPRSVRPNLLPNAQVQGLDRLITTLEEKAFSQLEAEVARIREDTALTTVTRDRFQELSASHRAMQDYYARPTRPAALYAARVRDLRADYLRQVEALGKDLQLEIPPQLLALYKVTVNNSQPPAAIAHVLRIPLRSRDPGEARSEPRPAAGLTFESGVELFHRGEYKEAYAIFRNLLQSQAEDARIWYYAALSYGLSSGDWGRATQMMAEQGAAREKENKPPKSQIDDALAGLSKETGRDWVDFYRLRAR
jgi:hypothetical protein